MLSLSISRQKINPVSSGGIFAEKLLFSTNYLLQRGRCCNGRYWDMPLGETAPKPSTIADDAAWMVAI